MMPQEEQRVKQIYKMHEMVKGTVYDKMGRTLFVIV